LINLSPVFAVLLAAPVLSERITAEKSGGLVLATLGASLILMSSTPLDGSFSFERLLGDAIVIVSTLFFAVNGIVGKIAVKSLDSISVTLYSTLFAVPFIWVSAVAFEDIAVLLSLSPLSWAIVLWVGVVNTVFAFMLYYEAMKHIEASKVQIALNLIAVWGVIMSVLVLGESISLMQILGGGLTVIGVLLARRSRDKSEGLTVESTAPVG
ncbi:MAG: DMT family transporter, partial [Candidatus Thorarchaeota archaeon]